MKKLVGFSPRQEHEFMSAVIFRDRPSEAVSFSGSVGSYRFAPDRAISHFSVQDTASAEDLSEEIATQVAAVRKSCHNLVKVLLEQLHQDRFPVMNKLEKERPGGDIYREVIKQVSQQIAETALENTHGNRKLTAKLLGISANTVRRAIEK